MQACLHVNIQGNTMNIEVSWETVSDGRTEQGAGFRERMRELVASGETLAITLPDGSVKTFDDADAFTAWFDKLDAAS